LIHLVSANGDLMVAAATRCGKTATFALPLIRRVQDGGSSFAPAPFVYPSCEIAARIAA
jgi:superfamily II DNA/RNA helicase